MFRLRLGGTGYGIGDFKSPCLSVRLVKSTVYIQSYREFGYEEGNRCMRFSHGDIKNAPENLFGVSDQDKMRIPVKNSIIYRGALSNSGEVL